ncbi:MAG TPA: alpha/beta fold hydrolase [Acidobacteriaceae bacterium]|nr:thioesterase domain-containing protein [Terriglobia bacterium]HVC89126.1 alpha/beta fold hydrolase [Acidobacteriaceae bacterium]
MQKQRSQFVIFRPRPAASFRVFCFPHAGGAPIAFFPWAEWFSEDIECVCLQYRGRAQRIREKPLTSIGEFVSEISEDLAALSDTPFAFYGHSFGGIVAFELARQLRRSGRPGPSHLFVGATRPPHLESPFSPIHALAKEDFIANVQSRYGGIPSVILEDAEVMKMFLPAMRGDFTAYESYRYEPGPPLDIPITAFGGAQDKAVEPECLYEWELHTQAVFASNILPGDHFFSLTSGKELVRTIEARFVAGRSERNATFAG